MAFLIGLAALLVLTAGAGVWLVRFRPLTVYEWTTRSALRRAGMRKVPVDSPAGRQIVWMGGKGPVLVLLHGAGDQAGTWSRILPPLLAAHTVIAPDLAGHGGSEPSRGPIEVSAVFEGLTAAIDTLAPGQRVVVAGNSLGAWMAMLFAYRRPESVSRLVCLDGAAIKAEGAELHLSPKTREEARASLARTRGPAAGHVPDYVLDDIVRRAQTGSLGRLVATSASMEAWVLDEQQVAGIQLPVRLIWGASDGLVPLDYAKRLQAMLKDARLEVIEGCGHVPQVQCPDAALAAIQKAVNE